MAEVVTLFSPPDLSGINNMVTQHYKQHGEYPTALHTPQKYYPYMKTKFGPHVRVFVMPDTEPVPASPIPGDDAVLVHRLDLAITPSGDDDFSVGHGWPT